MKDMMQLDQIVRRLEGMNLTYVMKKTGLTYPTLRRVRKGQENINVTTWRKLSEFFHAESSL